MLDLLESPAMSSGCYSSLVATDPRYVLDMYAKARAGQWDHAIGMQQHLATFLADAMTFLEGRDEGAIDPVFDKGLGVASGCILGHQRCCPPYIGWSDETVSSIRGWLKENYPEFVYPGASV